TRNANTVTCHPARRAWWLSPCSIRLGAGAELRQKLCFGRSLARCHPALRCRVLRQCAAAPLTYRVRRRFGHRASARGQRPRLSLASTTRRRAHGRTRTSCSGQVLDGSNRYREAGVEPTFVANVGLSATITLDSMELYWNG